MQLIVCQAFVPWRFHKLLDRVRRRIVGKGRGGQHPPAGVSLYCYSFRNAPNTYFLRFSMITSKSFVKRCSNGSMKALCNFGKTTRKNTLSVAWNGEISAIQGLTKGLWERTLHCRWWCTYTTFILQRSSLETTDFISLKTWWTEGCLIFTQTTCLRSYLNYSSPLSNLRTA